MSESGDTQIIELSFPLEVSSFFEIMDDLELNLFILREFKKQDLSFFLRLLHPKEILHYIKSELNNHDFSNGKK
jgi:hypothetical protein